MFEILKANFSVFQAQGTNFLVLDNESSRKQVFEILRLDCSLFLFVCKNVNLYQIKKRKLQLERVFFLISDFAYR